MQAGEAKSFSNISSVTDMYANHFSCSFYWQNLRSFYFLQLLYRLHLLTSCQVSQLFHHSFWYYRYLQPETDLAMFNDRPSLLSSLMKLKTIIGIINQQGRILSWLRNKWREFHNFCPQVKSFCSIWVKGHGHWDAMSIPGLWIHYLKKSLRGFI